MRQFWVSYEMGLLQLGTGDVFTHDLLSWQLEGMSPLQRISIATDNKIGLWEVAQDLGKLMATGVQDSWCIVMALSYNIFECVNLFPTLGGNIGPQLSLRWSCEPCYLACPMFHLQLKSMLLVFFDLEKSQNLPEGYPICLIMLNIIVVWLICRGRSVQYLSTNVSTIGYLHVMVRNVVRHTNDKVSLEWYAKIANIIMNEERNSDIFKIIIFKTCKSSFNQALVNVQDFKQIRCTVDLIYLYTFLLSCVSFWVYHKFVIYSS